MMTMTLPNADYLYYQMDYCGTAIKNQTDFDFYSKMAFDIIESRITTSTEKAEQKIKMCNCRIAEILYYYRLDNKVVSSESVGEHSVSYLAPSLTAMQEISIVISTYLANTGLLYRGI